MPTAKQQIVNLKRAMRGSVARHPDAGCQFHRGEPHPLCGPCYLADYSEDRIQKSLSVMRRTGGPHKRVTKVKDSYYRQHIV